VKRSLPAPRAPELTAELTPRELEGLAHDAACAQVELGGSLPEGQLARGVSLEEGVLSGLEAPGARLEALRLLDCEVRGCNLANVRAPRASIVRASFATCRMTGLQLPDAHLRDVAFRDCRIDLASFAGAHFERVSFEDCVLAGSDFLETQLASVRFVRCRLAEADLRGARVEGCELRRCELSGLHGLESLAGAAMEWEDIIANAGTLAAALGIAVLDERQSEN
jgi:uncharacterized protein YjbI with pentapeptide repeats